jgi:multiple sugar transport system permease protein
VKLIQAFRKNKFLYLINLCLAILFLAPLMWTVSTSLKTAKNIVKYPPEWIPHPLTLENFQAIWSVNNGVFGHYFMNSVTLTLLTVFLVVAIGSAAGYGFSKLTIPLKQLFLILILSTLMIPFHTLLIPLFSVMKSLNLLNTHVALVIIYVTFHLPVAIFMMINSFDAVPNSIRESALMDGSSEIQTYLRIMLPLVWPGLATVAIYTAYTTWNDYIVALVFTSSDEMRTLNVGLTNMAIGQYGTDYGLLTSGSFISFIPMILLFAFLQRFFINGLTSGAVK